MIRTRLALLVLAAAAAACGRAPSPDQEAEARAIRATAARQNALFAAQDTLGIGALYAPDAELLPPGRPRVVGADSIRHGFALSAQGNTGLRLTTVEVRVARAGDVAVEEGVWVWRGQGTSGPIEDRGKYVVVWVKRDGDWKIHRDIFNSDLPAPVPVAPAATPPR